MQIIFVRDAQAVQTGNEYYAARARADLPERHARWLIENGYAVDVKNKPEKVQRVKKPKPPSMPDYKLMTVSVLRKVASEAGFSHSHMKKAQLVSALRRWWRENNGG